MFFGLSYADTRWEEKFSALLRDLGIKITYGQNNESDEIVVLSQLLAKQ